LTVLRDKKRVVVEGVNMRIKNLKKKYWEAKGSSMMVPASIHYSNVNLVDPTCGLATRVGTGYLDDGTKVRISKRTGAIIPKPVWERARPKNVIAIPWLDTSQEDAQEITYEPAISLPRNVWKASEVPEA